MKTGKDVSFCIDSNYHKGTNTTLKSRRQLVLEQRERDVKTTVAYSKSTRKTHIDIRGKVDGEANTVSTGDGGSNQSTQNFVAVHYGHKDKEHEYKDVSPTLKAQSHGHEPMAVEIEEADIRIRKLTPVECERLQGYPDNHTKFGKKEDGTTYEMSNTQRYKQCGNGVSSPVAATILSTLIPSEDVRVQSLFSGILGTELDLPERFKLTGTCEFDKYASDVIRFHKPSVPNFKDVTQFVDRNDVPDFDLLTFGFPCQSFSIAGLRQGFEDEKGRGTLIYNVFDILQKHKPKYFMAENVKGLINHDGGKTIIQILTGLSQLGYELDFELVNSKHYGLAQNRERVFIFGRLK
jgi:site-specific DNA-cytosine methylase